MLIHSSVTRTSEADFSKLFDYSYSPTWGMVPYHQLDGLHGLGTKFNKVLVNKVENYSYLTVFTRDMFIDDTGDDGSSRGVLQALNCGCGVPPGSPPYLGPLSDVEPPPFIQRCPIFQVDISYEGIYFISCIDSR